MDITRSSICAGFVKGGKGDCYYDSGGPLFKKGKDWSKDVLFGLTSSGYGCAQKNTPGVYTNVKKFRSWIDEKVKRNSKASLGTQAS